ncbi:MAG: TonB-dependent receptor [Marinilabilia sp.]
MDRHKHIGISKIVAVACIVMASFSSVAQNIESRTVQIEKQEGSAVELIEHLQEQSGMVISYSSRLCLDNNIVLSSSENSLLGFLNEIFRDCSFEYEVREDRIILQPAEVRKKTATVTGYVSDGKTGERLLGANVFSGEEQIGTATNNYGFFSITLPAGRNELQSSYVGYESQRKSFDLERDTVINFRLDPNVKLPEVSVLGSRMPNMLDGSSFGSVRVSMEQILDAPSLFGETDLMRGIQMLPGIQSGTEGFSGLYVRGGGPDQNLVLLDDVPVYNVGHLLGFFSIFNTDAVKQVSVTKEGFPARYGGRLSSVVDIRMKDGREDKIGGNVSLGLLSSGISLDGPVLEDKSTFALSFRRTYVDALAALYQLGEEEKTNYYFFDLNGKINYEFSDRSKVYLSLYWGRDKFYTLYNFREHNVSVGEGSVDENVTINDESNAGWGNFTGALRWNYVFNSRFFANFTGTFSNYRFFIGLKRNDESEHSLNAYEQRYLSGIRDFNLKGDFEYYPGGGHTIRFGASGVAHRFNPGIDVFQTSSDEESEETILEDVRVSGEEYRAYAEDEFRLGSRIRGNAGLHLALFRGEKTPYWSVEPRLALEYGLSSRMNLKGSYSRMSQFVHLVGTAGFSLPTDLWLPVTNNIEPMRSRQISLGADFYLDDDEEYILSADLYSKSFKNLLAYNESTGFFDYSASWEDKLTAGTGKSEGGELMVQKNKGALTGWLSYTYARTNSVFTELNDGKSFPARFDRRHDASLFMNYRFNERVTGSLNWLFGSGNPITLPEEKYFAPELPFGERPEYGYSENLSAVNNYRMPSFHRLDLGVNFTKERKRGERTWSFGLINAYGRQNPFLLYFSESEDAPEGSSLRQLKQLSLFPFPIPYVRYSFKF